MSYPTVAQVLEGGSAAASSFTPDLTTLSTLAVGDRLLLVAVIESTSTVTPPASDGWNESIDNVMGSYRAYFALKSWAAGQDTTPTFTIDSGTPFLGWQLIQVRPSAGAAITSFETANDTGSSGNPDPPNLTPVPGSRDYLYVAIGFATEGISAGPSGYSGFNGNADWHSRTALAYKNVTAASENPGAFTASAPAYWWADTIAVWQDPVPITISSLDPADNATGVAVDVGEIAVTFDLPWTAATPAADNIKLYDADNDLIGQFSVSSATGSGTDTLTLDISSLGDLEGVKGHYVKITATAITGFAGILDTTTWNFTTESTVQTVTIGSNNFAPTIYGPDIAKSIVLGENDFALTISAPVVVLSIVLTVDDFAPTIYGPVIVADQTIIFDPNDFAPVIHSPKVLLSVSFTTDDFAPTIYSPSIVGVQIVVFDPNDFAPTVYAPEFQLSIALT